MARVRAIFGVISRWAMIVSIICSSMVSTGLRLVIGSWKIIAMSRPRIDRSSSSRSVVRSCSSNRT